MTTDGVVAALQQPAVDSGATRRVEIAAQPLADALAALARQTGLRVTVDAPTLAAQRSAGVSGTYSGAEALRRLLEGTGLVARYTDAVSVVVCLPGATGVADRSGAQSLGRVVVTGAATRRRGYAAVRTTSATKTDTPLRDTPQAVTVVSRDLIADQQMQSMGDVVRYVPGVTMGQGEGHRDAPTIRGTSSTACATTRSTSATCTTSSASRRSRARTR